MTVRFFSNYDTSANLLKRFLDNYIVGDNALTFTIAEDYEFAVVFNRTYDFIRPGCKIITVIQEPSWSPAHQDTSFLTGSDYLIIHDPEIFRKRLGLKLGGEIIESPSYMFYHDHVDKSFFNCITADNKVKKLSMVVSGLNVPVGIYQKRFGLLKKILASDLDIDIYGKGLVINDQRYKGFIDYKFAGLIPYEYSIAVENSEEKNYLTEKFVDCVLCSAIPIYHGAPNVDDIYDKQYFRHIDPESPMVIEDIKRIIAEPAPFSMINKAIYENKYNLYNKLKEIILT